MRYSFPHVLSAATGNFQPGKMDWAGDPILLGHWEVWTGLLAPLLGDQIGTGALCRACANEENLGTGIGSRVVRMLYDRTENAPMIDGLHVHAEDADVI